MRFSNSVARRSRVPSSKAKCAVEFWNLRCIFHRVDITQSASSLRKKLDTIQTYEWPSFESLSHNNYSYKVHCCMRSSGYCSVKVIIQSKRQIRNDSGNWSWFMQSIVFWVKLCKGSISTTHWAMRSISVQHNVLCNVYVCVIFQLNTKLILHEFSIQCCRICFQVCILFALAS